MNTGSDTAGRGLSEHETCPRTLERTLEMPVEDIELLRDQDAFEFKEGCIFRLSSILTNVGGGTVWAEAILFQETTCPGSVSLPQESTFGSQAPCGGKRRKLYPGFEGEHSFA